jgi:hypothetical protein
MPTNGRYGLPVPPSVVLASIYAFCPFGILQLVPDARLMEIGNVFWQMISFLSGQFIDLKLHLALAPGHAERVNPPKCCSAYG